MQHIDRHVGGNRVDLLQRRQPLFGELVCRPAPDDADPLARGRPLRLLFEHPQSVGQRRDVIPPQLHREVVALSDDMGVAVDQARDRPLAAEVYGLCPGPF